MAGLQGGPIPAIRIGEGARVSTSSRQGGPYESRRVCRRSLLGFAVDVVCRRFRARCDVHRLRARPGPGRSGPRQGPGVQEREAKDLLGAELESGKGRTIITVEVSATKDSGFTWPIDHPDRKFHEMWLTTSRERAAGSTLRHEIRHVVLNTRFPDRLPPWIEEGLASRSDDPQRQRVWRETAAGFSRSGWPDIHSLVEAKSIHSTDQATYSAATSLVNYLLTRGDMAKLLQFAVTGKKSGWDRALDQCYGIRSLPELESQWHAWVGQERRSARTRPRAPPSGSPAASGRRNCDAQLRDCHPSNNVGQAADHILAVA